MSRYPDLSSGGRFTGAVASSMIEDVYVKSSTTDRTSTTVLAADPELSAIPLGVGTWQVELDLFFSTATTNTQKLATQWSFSGTWNTPIRFCIGPGSTNTAVRSDITPSQFSGVPSNTSVIYGGAASTGFNVVLERCYLVVVTVAGNLALTWAQSVSSVNATSVKVGSAMRVRQIG